MKPQDEAVEAWRHMERRKIKPSARRVSLMLRAMGIRCDDHEVRRWVRGFETAVHRKNSSVSTAPQENDSPQSPPQSHPRLRAQKVVSLVPSSSSDKSSEAPTLFGNEATKVTPIRKRSPEPEIDVSWRAPLIESANALLDRPLNTWTADERFIWARWHCLTFGNCTKREGSNKTKASSVAAALATMALAYNYGEMTGRQYFRLAKAVHDQRDEKPWFDPWLVKGAINAVAARA